MSNGFLKRWSRLKRMEDSASNSAKVESHRAIPPLCSRQPFKSQAEEGFPAASSLRSSGNQEGAAPTADPRSAHEEEVIDLATLPPLESLGSESDYTVFLKKGVPEPLRIAALRRAWVSDPFIRDFRGPAEYALDYTTSEFDLRPTDDVAEMLDHIFPPKPNPASVSAAPKSEPEVVAPTSDAKTNAYSTDPAHSLPQNRAGAAMALHPSQQAKPAAVPQQRKHGGALPT